MGLRSWLVCRNAGVFVAALLVVNAVGAADDWLAERQNLANRTDVSVSAPQAAAQTARDLAEAMGAPMEWLRDAELLAAEAQAAALPNLGVIRPLAGQQLGVLSTGRAGEPARPGTAFSTSDEGQPARLVLHFDPPAGGRQLSFHYRFLTAEFPEFAAAGFADQFQAFITDANGRRELTRIDAADPAIVPVSAETAAGTGFDLFSDERGRISGEFDFGLPAAGLTGWRRIEAEIAQTGPITIEFEIRDAGDPLLDSTVVLDNLTLNAIRMERPAPTQPRVLDQELDCLLQGGLVVGSVADGVTPIRVSYFNLPGPGTVTFSFPSGAAPEDGGWGDLGTTDRLPEITVQTQFGQNGHEGVTQYLVPEEFNRGGNENQVVRDVTFRLHFIPDDPAIGPRTANLNFQLWRPPLILMHGLWSSEEEAWDESPLRNDGRLLSFPGDYEPTNAAHFRINTRRPVTPIREACNFMWDRLEVALSQVDYVGHSMGGILGRNFNAEQPGLINKLFTVNTPHTGSPLANFVVQVRSWVDNRSERTRNWIYGAIEKIAGPIDQGALDDLAVGSSEILAIPATNLPSHALVGRGGSDLVGDALSLAPGKIGLLFSILSFIDSNTELFAGIQHDLVVGRRSQEGGISPSAITVFGGLHSIHTEATNSSEYRDRILDLLNTDQTTAEFAGFPSPTSLQDWPTPLARTDPGTEFSEGEIEITSPAPSETFGPGEPIPVSVAAIGGFELASTLVFGSDEGVLVEQAPFEANISAPQRRIGPMTISALGKSEDGTVTFTDSVEVFIQTDASLDSIEITQRNPVLFDHSDRRQLSVLGTFSDGVVRNITHPSAGTVYTSANESIVRVTEGGRLIPVGEGETTVLAQNDGRQDSITVRVNEILYLFIDRFQPEQP